MAAALDLITSAMKAGHTTLADTATSMARREGVPRRAIDRAIATAYAGSASGERAHG